MSAIPGWAWPLSRKRHAPIFYGRDEEVAELARRVQRKLLTVLFGQSGLGKTSILRAGLVPRLRGPGILPDLRAHRLRQGVAGTGRADQTGDQPHRTAVRRMDPGGGGRRGRVLVGIPASSRRRAARRVRRHSDPTADLRSVRGNFHAGAKRRIRPRARRTLHRGAGRSGREPAAEVARGEARRRRVCAPSASISRAATIEC